MPEGERKPESRERYDNIGTPILPGQQSST
jgi:hypothetical protein